MSKAERFAEAIIFPPTNCARVLQDATRTNAAFPLFLSVGWLVSVLVLGLPLLRTTRHPTIVAVPSPNHPHWPTLIDVDLFYCCSRRRPASRKPAASYARSFLAGCHRSCTCNEFVDITHLISTGTKFFKIKFSWPSAIVYPTVLFGPEQF